MFGPGSRQIAQVLPYLYLSDISCASDAVVSQVGFTHIVSILSGPIPWLGPSPSCPATVLSITCDDDPEADITPHFDAVNAFIQDALLTSKSKDIKILIHCLAGVSRSPTICAAYLIKVYGMRRDDALALIRDRREVVEPNQGFLHQLAVYEAKVRGTTLPPTPNPHLMGSGMCATMMRAPTPTPTPTSAIAMSMSTPTPTPTSAIGMGMNTPTPTPTSASWAPCIVSAPTRNAAPRIRIPLAPSRA